MDSLSGMISSAVQFQQEKTQMEVQMGVLKKTQQVEKEVGEMLVGLIAQAAGTSTAQKPGKVVGVGANLDISG